jgi:hypothetical protein
MKRVREIRARSVALVVSIGDLDHGSPPTAYHVNMRTFEHYYRRIFKHSALPRRHRHLILLLFGASLLAVSPRHLRQIRQPKNPCEGPPVRVAYSSHAIGVFSRCSLCEPAHLPTTTPSIILSFHLSFSFYHLTPCCLCRPCIITDSSLAPWAILTLRSLHAPADSSRSTQYSPKRAVKIPRQTRAHTRLEKTSWIVYRNGVRPLNPTKCHILFKNSP